MSRLESKVPRLVLAALAALAAIAALASCAGGPSPAGSGPRSAGKPVATRQDVEAACFEVVIRKPGRDSLSYEGSLDLSALPYRERTDEYWSVGTAFAINARELVTAAHVVGFLDDSPVAPSRFIRERRREGDRVTETVYEFDQVTAFDSRKDYAVFTVKDKSFERWFTVAAPPALDSGVFTAGNAYGEGIVVRQGNLLDRIPEDVEGAWTLLKSSAPANPGNSGGPLLDGKLRAIGVVLSRKDDFCYSLPVDGLEPGRARAWRRINAGFATFSDRRATTMSVELPVPTGYRAFMERASAEYAKAYEEAMDGLFASLGGDLFPAGPTSLAALTVSGSARFPQVYLRDSDDKHWFASSLKPQSAELKRNGRVSWSRLYENSGTWLFAIEAPDGVDPGALWREPKLMMDSLLAGIKITRNVGEKDQGTRITSYGKPALTEDFVDAWGRKWRSETWYLEYMDRAVLTASVPTPEGAILIYMSCDASEAAMYQYDIRRMADFTSVSYVGTFDQWSAFLGWAGSRGAPLDGIKVSVAPGSRLDAEADGMGFRNLALPFALSPDSLLGFYYDFMLRGGTPRLSLRRIVLDDGLSDGDFLSLMRWARPDAALPKQIRDSWKTLIEGGGHPYDREAFREDGQTAIGFVLPRAPGDDFAATCYLGRKSRADEAQLAAALPALEAGMYVGR